MSDHVLKSVQLASKNGILRYKPYPNDELKVTFHWLSIGSVSIFAKNSLDTVCTIICNSVQTQKLSDTFQIETFESPLQTFQINVKKDKYFHVNFNVLWHSIKKLREDLIFKIVTFDQNILENVDVKMVLLFR